MVGDFGPIITLIVVIALALIAVLRLGVKFDINEYQKSRKKRHLSLARLYCPHIRLEKHKQGVSCQSLFVSPSGTMDWVCTQCGVVTHVAPSDEEIEKLAEYYFSNYEEYTKKMKKFEKHAKKSL